MTMVSQESTHKRFFLEISQEVTALLTPENRAFLAAKCEEFWRRVDDIETRCKEAHDECERCAKRLGPRWHWDGHLVVERRFCLRAPKKWPSVDPDTKYAEFCRRVERVEARRKATDDAFNACTQRLALRWKYGIWGDATIPNKPKSIHVERQFYLEPTAGDPRHWFPPHAVWWKDPRPEEELPNEQDALLRDCVLLSLIHDLTFPRHRPVYFTRDRECPGGDWWHKTLYASLVTVSWILDRNSPDVEHLKQFIRQSLKNVAEARGAQGPPAAKDEEGKRYLFKNEGATWRVIYGGRETTVRDSKGMKYIHYLVGRRGQETESLEIDRQCNARSERDMPSAGEQLSADDDMHEGELDLNMLDRLDIEKAVEVVKGAIAKWKRELDETHDPSEQADLNDKITKGERYTTQNMNRRGRVRPSGAAEEARKRVSAAINAAKRSITKNQSDIGQHFQKSVTARGTAFIYEPDRELNWVLL